jgi:hypothetical protein
MVLVALAAIPIGYVLEWMMDLHTKHGTEPS